MGTYQLIRRYPNGATQYIEDILPYGGRTRGTETSKYPEEEKITNDFLSSGERKGKSPNHPCYGIGGVVGLQRGISKHKWNGMGSPAIHGDSPVHV